MKERNYIFYKLCCDDCDDIYVGSTSNFSNRKYEHKSSVNNPNAKNYKVKTTLRREKPKCMKKN